MRSVSTDWTLAAVEFMVDAMTRAPLAIPTILVLAACGCGEDPAPTPSRRRVVGTARATAAGSSTSSAPNRLSEVEARRRGGAFGKALKGELITALGQGPAHAVKVCGEVAPTLAQKMSDEHISVRRIGTRARRPEQKASNKELAVLETLTPEAPWHFTEAKAMKALYVSGVCLSCHGKNLSEDTKMALSKHYPKDEATGYEMGELRGAIVVELTAGQ